MISWLTYTLTSVSSNHFYIGVYFCGRIMTVNNVKYVIPLLAWMLLIPVGMSDTFAQSGPNEEYSIDEIGPIGVVEEHTAESHKLRIDIKKQDVLNLEI